MDLQSNPKLDEIYRLTLENNRMLHKMRREAVYRSILGMIWWAIFIIGPALLYYYYLQPYVDQMLELYAKLPGFENVQLPKSGIPDISGILNNFSNMLPSAGSTTGATTTGN